MPPVFISESVSLPGLTEAHCWKWIIHFRALIYSHLNLYQKRKENHCLFWSLGDSPRYHSNFLTVIDVWYSTNRGPTVEPPRLLALGQRTTPFVIGQQAWASFLLLFMCMLLPGDLIQNYELTLLPHTQDSLTWFSTLTSPEFQGAEPTASFPRMSNRHNQTQRVQNRASESTHSLSTCLSPEPQHVKCKIPPNLGGILDSFFLGTVSTESINNFEELHLPKPTCTHRIGPCLSIDFAPSWTRPQSSLASTELRYWQIFLPPDNPPNAKQIRSLHTRTQKLPVVSVTFRKQSKHPGKQGWAWACRCFLRSPSFQAAHWCYSTPLASTLWSQPQLHLLGGCNAQFLRKTDGVELELQHVFCGFGVGWGASAHSDGVAGREWLGMRWASDQ